MVPSSILLDRIRSMHPGIAKVPDEINDTARSFRLPSHRGSIGFISSMSDHFCGTCNRLRLTADGQIKVCGLSNYSLWSDDYLFFLTSRSAFSTVKRSLSEI